MYSQADLNWMNAANGPSALPLRHGHRAGRGRCVFNASDVAGSRTIAAHGLGLTIPAGAYLKRVLYVVTTTFTSATDAATIALKAEGAGDLKAAVAISNGANPWDASTPVESLIDPTDLTKMILTTVDRELTATVAVEALTAGRMVVFAEWLYLADAYYL